MKPLDSFLIFGTVALSLLVGAVVYRSRNANFSQSSIQPPSGYRSAVRRPGIDSVELRRYLRQPLHLGVKAFYRYGEPLPDGYRCSGADGLVYKSHEVDGATVIDPLRSAGLLVRCAGDARSSHR